MENKHLYIVTGSTKGLGKALVEELLKWEGATVVGMGRSVSSIEHPNYLHIQVDFSELTQVKSMMNQIFLEGDYQSVCLINNAGWIGEIAHLGNLSAISLEKIMNINVVVPALLMNEFVSRFKDKDQVKRVVVNISSGAAVKSIDGWLGYCGSKAALNRMTEVAQQEAVLEKTGIKYFAVAPGVVDTDMQQEIRNSRATDFSSVDHFVQLKNDNLLLSPQDVAGKILSLIEFPERYLEVIQDVRTMG
jgi:benzil reductase ((S)-benzoin forming)